MEAQQSADLAARLTKRLADANRDRNLVFSPLSIHAVLALLAAGAGGDTLEEILRVLGARSRSELVDSVARLLDGPLRDRSSEPDGGGPSVAFACGVWSDLTRPLKPAFRDAVVGKYKAEASSVDFRRYPEQAVQQIDAWAAAATRNLIHSAVPPGAVHRGTDLVLANAIYFRGKWDLPFYESSTKNRPFYRLDGTAVDVPFMSNYDRHFIAEHDGFKVLQLHYKRSSRAGEPAGQDHVGVRRRLPARAPAQGHGLRRRVRGAQVRALLPEQPRRRAQRPGAPPALHPGRRPLRDAGGRRRRRRRLAVPRAGRLPEGHHPGERGRDQSRRRHHVVILQSDKPSCLATTGGFRRRPPVRLLHSGGGVARRPLRGARRRPCQWRRGGDPV
ncbi:hypothetical protein CFC21_072813, partial [Triticum aestivum]|uniref:Serpin domain-containing protein n=2 Tax=Triticum aestivum TaxID=4565 RepID=A0A3B6LR24_WHEAT